MYGILAMLTAHGRTLPWRGVTCRARLRETVRQGLVPWMRKGALYDALERVKGDARVSVRQWDKILRRVLRGQADQHVRFADLLGLLVRLGFDERIRGDHHALGKPGGREILDLQPLTDGKAKAYQVKQVRAILRAYGLTKLP